MPQPDPNLMGAMVTFGTIVGGWGGERLLRLVPAFPYQGERMRAFVATVSALSLFFAALGNWATGTLSAADLTGLWWAAGQAIIAIAVAVATYRGKSPQAYQRHLEAEAKAEADAYQVSWRHDR